MHVLRPRSPVNLTVSAVGGMLALLGTFLAVHMGADASIGLAVVATLFVGLAALGFIAYPHLAIAATVVLFILIPALQVFVWDDIGAVKDLVVLAAAAAAGIVFVFERRLPDRWVLGLVVALLALYVLNIGREHDVAWAHGIRLAAEPLLLLLAGLVLPQPRRTLRFALGALIATGCLVAVYGLVQQVVGGWTLVSWGYDWGDQVRTLDGSPLRSFGTLGDPFAYAALLMLGIAAVAFWLRSGLLAWGAGLLMLVGAGLSFVRTAALVLVAFAGLELVHRGHATVVVLAVAAAVGAGGLMMAVAGPDRTANAALDDRIPVWSDALSDDPVEWVVGRGVGEVGTAAERATFGIGPAEDAPELEDREFVDSGYLATLADVGLVGLAVLLALFGRLIVLGADAARRGMRTGWLVLAVLAALLIDALTRDSFTAFPTAYLALLLVGVALATAKEEPGSTARTA